MRRGFGRSPSQGTAVALTPSQIPSGFDQEFLTVGVGVSSSFPHVAPPSPPLVSLTPADQVDRISPCTMAQGAFAKVQSALFIQLHLCGSIAHGKITAWKQPACTLHCKWHHHDIIEQGNLTSGAILKRCAANDWCSQHTGSFASRHPSVMDQSICDKIHWAPPQ